MMRLIKPSFEILTKIDGEEILRAIEVAGRTCYKSEDKITNTSSLQFCKNIMKRGHLSVIEHINVSVRLIIDRGVSHELVRHRLCSFSQESTRYCNYESEVVFIIPPWLDLSAGDYNWSSLQVDLSDVSVWLMSLYVVTDSYNLLLSKGWLPQQARSILPNALKTEIVVTANLREWLHIFTLRTAKAAHPQMREIMIPLCKEFQKSIPIIFDGVVIDET